MWSMDARGRVPGPLFLPPSGCCNGWWRGRGTRAFTRRWKGKGVPRWQRRGRAKRGSALMELVAVKDAY